MLVSVTEGMLPVSSIQMKDGGGMPQSWRGSDAMLSAPEDEGQVFRIHMNGEKTSRRGAAATKEARDNATTAIFSHSYIQIHYIGRTGKASELSCTGWMG